MATRRKQYSREFKLEAVRLVTETTRPIAEIARELGINQGMLRRWQAQAARRSGLAAGAIFPGPGQLQSPDQELARLKRENEILRQERDFLKKAAAFFAVKYAVIARHVGEFPVRLMCRVLAVSASGFYAAQHRAPSARTTADARLTVAIHAVHRRTRRRYGSPRVTRELRAAGTPIGRKRVARLMRTAGLRGRGRVARRPRTTDSTHAGLIAPNVVGRRFGVDAVAGRNRVWVADLTYVPTGMGWLYLAVVLDLGSRPVGRPPGSCITPTAGCSTRVRSIRRCSPRMA